MKKSNTVQYHGVGRRKKSVARVFLRPGTGNIVVNGKTLEEYLPLETLRMVVKSPLEITNTADQFDVIINVQGGGYTGQSGAMRHGITRALMEASEDYRPVLKAAKLQDSLLVTLVLKNVKNTVLKQLVVLHNSLNVSILLLKRKQKPLYKGFFLYLKHYKILCKGHTQDTYRSHDKYNKASVNPRQFFYILLIASKSV